MIIFKNSQNSILPMYCVQCCEGAAVGTQGVNFLTSHTGLRINFTHFERCTVKLKIQSMRSSLSAPKNVTRKHGLGTRM